MIISVCGNIASGKTTLAKNICAMYPLTYVPSKRGDLNFLDAFFQDIPSHFLSTQTYFLTNKVLEISELHRQGKNILIDRSFQEDIHVFAQLWMDNYKISEHDKSLYRDLSAYLVSTVPQTDVYIYCKCNVAVQEERFHERETRSFEGKYPPNYFDWLRKKYSNISFPDNALVVEVDTEICDVRKESTVKKIMKFIGKHLSENSATQLSLWDEHYIISDNKSTEDCIFNGIRLAGHFKRLFPANAPVTIKKKTIYIAAPFTEFATEMPASELSPFFEGMSDGRKYHLLPPAYQTRLGKIKKLLSYGGHYNTILPHKEENNWGKTYITNQQVIHAMLYNMKRSDMIVAIISDSIGVHMEIAMMAIQNKPMILLIVGGLTNGFYASGFEEQSRVLILHVETIDQCYKALNSETVTKFIQKELDGDIIVDETSV